MSTTTIENRAERVMPSPAMPDSAVTMHRLGSLALIQKLLKKTQAAESVDPYKTLVPLHPDDREIPNLFKAQIIRRGLWSNHTRLSLPIKPGLLDMSALIYTPDRIGSVMACVKEEQYDSFIAAASHNTEIDEALISDISTALPTITFMSVDDDAVRLHSVGTSLTVR